MTARHPIRLAPEPAGDSLGHMFAVATAAVERNWAEALVPRAGSDGVLAIDRIAKTGSRHKARGR
jgi:hypothetical protein